MRRFDEETHLHEYQTGKFTQFPANYLDGTTTIPLKYDFLAAVYVDFSERNVATSREMRNLQTVAHVTYVVSNMENINYQVRRVGAREPIC